MKAGCACGCEGAPLRRSGTLDDFRSSWPGRTSERADALNNRNDVEDRGNPHFNVRLGVQPAVHQLSEPIRKTANPDTRPATMHLPPFTFRSESPWSRWFRSSAVPGTLYDGTRQPIGRKAQIRKITELPPGSMASEQMRANRRRPATQTLGELTEVE